MDFDHSPKVVDLLARVEHFMQAHIYPREQEHKDFVHDPDNLWKIPPFIEELKEKAKTENLWNLFLPSEYGDYSAGLTNLEYAPLAELMGRVEWASEIFNCSAPDTGNMEVLARYGTDQQKAQWLEPLLAGEIRSSFLMTEPEVASSDATNIETSIVSDGDDYVISGRKWWSSGAYDPRCKVLIVMGKTNPDAPKHAQQSMILVPIEAEGVRLIRPLTVLNAIDSPHGHAEVALENVRVPKSNLILGEGKGFEIAQGRLGPGRIHHCMRLIGAAQHCLDLMCHRVESRVAFGKKISEQGSIRHEVAKSRCEIEQARLLTLSAADKLDKYGNKHARDVIAMIKIVVPRMCQEVADRAMQAHGGMGLSRDTPLVNAFVYARFVRMADGPDEVHLSQLGKMTIGETVAE